MVDAGDAGGRAGTGDSDKCFYDSIASPNNTLLACLILHYLLPTVYLPTGILMLLGLLRFAFASGGFACS